MLIRIGSRASQLALWQSRHIAERLRALGHTVDIVPIETTGDRMAGIPFARVGSKGMFTLELEEALAEGRVELAVHSLKDLPTQLEAGFAIAAVTQRADPRDAFVSQRFAGLSDLPPGSRIGTSSLRRQAQLRARWPQFEYVEFRGNVDTRLRKLREGVAEAAVLASAGLDRLGRTEWLRERIAPEAVCPAPGQGALALETRAGHTPLREALTALEDAETRFAITAERTALAWLGGGCQAPIGAYCYRDGDNYRLLGCIGSPTGDRIVRAERRGREAVPLGERLAADLLERGGRELLAQVPALSEPLGE